ncbi:DUF1501 domain-containing protein [Caenimonas sp. SL110]|uniref:DUF1501 domain-containing protein n=1 Tax=Caenimonas sp. SL110 TaxID=1450524 RepID=UPI00065439D0|nr:DUF1501 domain-containing protein [Caenimonas sp. SL110]
MKRRDFLKYAAGVPALGGITAAGLLGASGAGVAAGSDYKALVCVFLNGGNDGNNVVIPTDGAYNDYSAGRYDLTLPKNSLIALNGSSAGHTLGVHPALAPLATLYNQQRLAFIANAGPLIAPTTAAQVLDHTGALPPFLLSHSDQVAMQQGWGGDEDGSGWAGRALEMLPQALRNNLNAVTMDNQRTLVLGRQSRVAFMNAGGLRYWGPADLAQPSAEWTQTVNRMAQWQFANEYEAEYSSTFGGAVRDSTLITQAMLQAQTPQGNFGNTYLGTNLRSLASVLPVFRSQGLRRQVFLVNWGSFDTHSGQRGSGPMTQDAQLAELAGALAAFDQANIASGVGQEVTTLVMSDFGRTLKPASGGGSDHSWGNNWWVMGGAVAGGQVYGQFPSMVLGGIDDFDRAGEGRFVPTTSSDQVGATLMQWLGLEAAKVPDVFPNLANFQLKNLGFMAS